MSPHHPQSQTIQHWQRGDRCRQSSSGTMGTAKPGESSLPLSHSTTGLVLSSTAHSVTGRLTFSEKQEGPMMPSYRTRLCIPEQSCHLAAVGGRVPFRGHSSLGFYGCCSGKFYLPVQLPAAVEGGMRTSEGPATLLPLQHQTTAP